MVPAWRLGLVPALGAAFLLLLAAFLAGDLPRYRYPADPLLAVVQAGGLVGLLSLARALLQRVRAKPAAPTPELSRPSPVGGGTRAAGAGVSSD